ncbi:MAG: cbb3-type cytochrome c oxidase subunit I [Anaerolineaceae bacterium]|nr:cbb3-type cytochrome c oxidase subunit I [Anaerolineaceae bacterium]
MQAAQSRDVPVLEFPKLTALKSERWLVGIHLIVAFSALSLGLLMGPFQAFHRAPALKWDIPIFSYYYQALTLHGVLNALVFTTFFIVGFSYFVTQRTLQRPMASIRAAWVAFVMMFVGLALAAFAIITGQANVLFTFYPPLVAHPTFYLGLTLVIVGSWVAGGNIFFTYASWKRDHKGKRVPLAVYATLANFIMWITATIGVAVEVLFLLLPLSLGLVQTTDPQVARIMFWFFGHPLVYFWLLPAYTAWYTMMPKQNGVRLFSDGLGRMAFLMIMILSIPIGVHHLFADPGVSEVAKLFHALLTLVVAFPSLLTAFNIAATLEMAGQKRGSKGLMGWVFKQNWGSPVMAGYITGMLIFIIGGITGIMNASFTLNIALHNTTWVPGHFHTTLAGGVFLTYMGIFYWLLPFLSGRKLFAPKLATAQVYLWFVGMLLFGMSMGRAGIEGAPRRTDVATAGYVNANAVPWLNLTAVAGMILLVSAILLYVVILGTLFASKKQEQAEAEPPIDTEAPADDPSPGIFENWRIWLVVIVISNLIMWGPVLIQALDFTNGFIIFGFHPNAPIPLK